jgi:hypothetical protein
VLLIARSGSSPPLFRQVHTFIGADIGWQFYWATPDDVAIRVFDRGTGGSGATEHTIHVAHLIIDPKTGSATELPDAT